MGTLSRFQLLLMARSALSVLSCLLENGKSGCQPLNHPRRHDTVILQQLVDPIIGFLPVWGTIMAGCVLSTLPLLIVFVAFQDKFMSSVVIGAVKE